MNRFCGDVDGIKVIQICNNYRTNMLVGTKGKPKQVMQTKMKRKIKRRLK